MLFYKYHTFLNRKIMIITMITITATKLTTPTTIPIIAPLPRTFLSGVSEDGGFERVIFP